MFRKFILLMVLLPGLAPLFAQDSVLVKNLVKDAFEHSQLERLATELMDGIGPRLVGSSKMKKSQDWIMDSYRNWGIPSENQTWGQWRGWERGVSHADMLQPWVKTLSGTQLAWSPATPKQGVTAEVVILPDAPDSLSFARMLPQVKGKLVLVSMPQPTGRPNDNWEKYARKEAYEKMKLDREQAEAAWQHRIQRSGFSARNIVLSLEKAGAAGVISSNWSRTYGANKIFGTVAKKIPVFDVGLEDYGLIYRLAENGKKPVVQLYAESKKTGMQPAFNTLGTIRGSEKPGEFVILSAHLDSWDGGTGATDNGTGTLIVMEAMRLLKKWYPSPKRTILAGHWGSEEQGLNGSRAFVKDHPEVVENIQAVFNQDGGTGRTNFINGAGFLNAYDFLGRWLRAIPPGITDIETAFPGTPSGGGSDNASFVAAGVPSFYLGTNNWDYGTVTWHTNLDTYDKIVFDELRRSVVATAILAYMASEDPDRASREKRRLSDKNSQGQIISWPPVMDPVRKGGVE